MLSQSSNYKQEQAFLPKGRYVRVPLNNLSSSSVPLAVSSSTLLQWRIPANLPHNLSKSFIGYTFTLPAVAAQYNVSFESSGCDLCTSVQFGTQSSVWLADIQNVDRYLSMAAPLDLSREEAQSRGETDMYYACNELNTQNLLPVGRDGAIASVSNASTRSYSELRHLNVCPLVNTALTVNRVLPLSTFTKTVLSDPVDRVYPQEMYLNMQTQSWNRMGFTSTSPNAFTIANCTALANPPSLVGVYMYLYVQTNTVLIDSLLDALNKGAIRYSIPWCVGFSQSSTQNQTSTAINIPLTSQYGRKLKRMLYAPFLASGVANYSWDHSNVNGSKINTIQTALDNINQQDYILNCFNPASSANGGAFTFPTATAQGSANCDDWRAMSLYLRGSAIGTYDTFQTLWVFADVWGMREKHEENRSHVQDFNIIDGLDLGGGTRLYQMNLGTASSATATQNAYTNGLVHSVFATFIRDVEVSRDGVRML